MDRISSFEGHDSQPKLHILRPVSLTQVDMADIWYRPSKQDMIGAWVLLIVQVHFWAWRYVSWYASFTKKQRGICWHSKLARWRFSGQSGQTDQTSPLNQSDRSRQVCQIANWTTTLSRSRWDDRNAYIEHPIRSLDEGVMPPGRPAPRSDRSDRSRDWSDRSEPPSPS